MNEPSPAKWTPLIMTGMPEGAEEWGSEEYAMREERWKAAQGRLTEKDRSRLDSLQVEQNREFAIETGQIENLYSIKPGVVSLLILHGFQGVTTGHTDFLSEEVLAEELQALLEDQVAAMDMVHGAIKDERPLSHSTLCEWHSLLTRHQKKVTGRTPDGRFGLVEFPKRDKGAYKLMPNNPRQKDGEIFEHCPPEQCRSEIDRMLDLYRDIHERKYPVAVEAAWLHHRFVRTHPFRDGNGRTSRLLVAYAYMRRGLPPPLIKASERLDYFETLDHANRGNLRVFTDFLQQRATKVLGESVALAENMAGREPSPREDSPSP